MSMGTGKLCRNVSCLIGDRECQVTGDQQLRIRNGVLYALDPVSPMSKPSALRAKWRNSYI